MVDASDDGLTAAEAHHQVKMQLGLVRIYRAVCELADE
jgi:hypothetical protein